MTKLSFAIALIISLALGFVLHEGLSVVLLFGLTGLIAAFVARIAPPGAERVYWLFLIAIIFLVGASFFGASFGRLWFILPIVFIVSYFSDRLTLKILRRL